MTDEEKILLKLEEIKLEVVKTNNLATNNRDGLVKLSNTVSSLDIAIRGNGDKIGIKGELLAIKEWIDNRKKYEFAIAMAITAQFLGFIFVIFRDHLLR
jgi:hypothetical protein